VIPDRIAGFAGPLGRPARGAVGDLAAADRDRAVRFAFPAHGPGRAPEAGPAGAPGGPGGSAHADTGAPVFCVCRRTVLPQLTAFLADGGRKIDQWHGTLATVEVNFDDQIEAFSNINTPEELAHFES